MQPVLKQARAFGIDPVPVEHRVLGLADSFVLWADLAVSFLVMVVGMFLVPGLGFQDALLAIVVGALIGNVLLGLAAVVGSPVSCAAAGYFVPQVWFYPLGALLVLVGGVESTYLLISGLPPFGIAGLAPWLGASLPSFVITFVLYTAVELVVLRRGVQAARTASA